MALKTKNTQRKFAHALLLPMVLIMQTGCGLSGLQTAMSNPVAAAPTTSSPALPATNLAGATAPLNTGINAQLAPTANTTSTAANSPQAQTLLQQLSALDQQAQQLMSQGVPETDTRITQIDSQIDTLVQQYKQLTGQEPPAPGSPASGTATATPATATTATATAPANSPQAQALLQQFNTLNQQAQQLLSQGVPETDTRITQIDSQLDTLDQQYQQLTGQPVPQTT